MAGARQEAALGADPEQSPAMFDQLVPARIHKISDTLEDLARLMLGEASGLGFTETRILAYLITNESASVADVSRDLRVDKAWISRRRQALATKRLITKCRDHRDSRLIIVSLTGKGRVAAERAFGVVTDTYNTIMNGVDEALADNLITILEGNLDAMLLRIHTTQKR